MVLCDYAQLCGDGRSTDACQSQPVKWFPVLLQKGCLAFLCAVARSSLLTLPSDMRRCFGPILYCKIYVRCSRFPPLRTRKPKPGMLSSNSICSSLPSGIFNLATVAWVNFIGGPI